MVLQPQWPEVYYGEALTLRCRIEGGEGVEWEYEWMVPNARSTDLRSKDEYRISYATGQDSGSYACLGRVKNETSATTWSDTFSLSVSPSESGSLSCVSDICLQSTNRSVLSKLLQANCSLSSPCPHPG